MKPSIVRFATTLAILAAFPVLGQGTLIFDQQSSTDGVYLEGALGDIQSAQPFGQSFTPSLSSVGFVRLYLYDSTGGGGGPGTLSINIRSASVTGTILGTSDPVNLPAGFAGLVNFYFSTPVPLVPQDTYAFQPFVVSGTRWGTLVDRYNYDGGTAFSLGAPVTTADLWFREGIIVPEPSSSLLVLLGFGILAAARARR
jgi:hypothetical protein